MRNLSKFLGVGIVLLSLSACDQKTDADNHASGNQHSAQVSGRKIALIDSKLTFTLPQNMNDETGKLGTQSNNMHVYANADGQQAVIVIVGDETPLSLSELSQKLQTQQRNRDPQLQVVSDKSVTLGNGTAQQLDSVISTNNHSSWSTVVFAKVNNKLVTLQISLPADNQSESQALASDIVNSIHLQ